VLERIWNPLNPSMVRRQESSSPMRRLHFIAKLPPDKQTVPAMLVAARSAPRLDPTDALFEGVLLRFRDRHVGPGARHRKVKPCSRLSRTEKYGEGRHISAIRHRLSAGLDFVTTEDDGEMLLHWPLRRVFLPAFAPRARLEESLLPQSQPPGESARRDGQRPLGPAPPARGGRSGSWSAQRDPGRGCQGELGLQALAVGIVAEAPGSVLYIRTVRIQATLTGSHASTLDRFQGCADLTLVAIVGFLLCLFAARPSDFALLGMAGAFLFMAALPWVSFERTGREVGFVGVTFLLGHQEAPLVQARERAVRAWGPCACRHTVRGTCCRLAVRQRAPSAA